MNTSSEELRVKAPIEVKMVDGEFYCRPASCRSKYEIGLLRCKYIFFTYTSTFLSVNIIGDSLKIFCVREKLEIVVVINLFVRDKRTIVI